MATTTEYCVNVLNTISGQWVIAGQPCPGSPSFVAIGLTTTYTIPALPAGSYQLVVMAFTSRAGAQSAPRIGDSSASSRVD